MFAHVLWWSRLSSSDRAVGHDRVEQPADRGAARVVVHRPAAAEDPRLVGVRVGVGADAGDGVGGIRGLGEVALQELDARADRVDVRVLEAGAEQRAVQLHHAGVLVDELVRLGVGHDRADAASR